MQTETKTAGNIWNSHPLWKRVLVYVTFCFLALVILIVAFAPSNDAVKPVQTVEQTGEQKAKDAIKMQFSQWDGSHHKTERAIKAALNDPDSYEHVETRAWPRNDGTIRVVTKFRAKNGFGGVMTQSWESIVSAVDGTVLTLKPLD